MAKKPLILVVDDDTKHRNMLATLLNEWGYATLEAGDGMEAVAIYKKTLHSNGVPAMALLDMRMPGMSGHETLLELLRLNPHLPIVIMTAYSEIPTAVEAMRAGAFDYLAKPLDFPRLQAVITNALNQADISGNDSDNDSAQAHACGKGLLGISRPMRGLQQLIKTVAPTEANILIDGESGTGKELVARAIHRQSKRAEGPFVAINCGALNESLLNSELFGHEKGAFTGADRKHPGLFMEAAAGSIFLDEIGELPASMQVKLLRVLQEREVLSVGGKKPQKIDCRVIAATNRNLRDEVERGTFREDLYYRLNVVSLHIPPLRERKEDIELLAQCFAQRFASANHKTFSGISPEAMGILEEYAWPGNVRELENVIERAIILMPGENIGLREIPPRILNNVLPENSPISEFPEQSDTQENRTESTLAEIERNVIMETLKKVGNNKTEAAKILGITRKTLHARLNRYKDNDEQE